MSEIDEDDIEVEPSRPAKIKQFFAGEAEAKLVETEELPKLVEFYASLKETERQVKEHLEKTSARIKQLMDADKLEVKKFSQSIAGHTVILTRRDGSVKVDWEQYVADMVNDQAVKELQAIKEAVKRGEAESKYVTVGKESVSLEVI